MMIVFANYPLLPEFCGYPALPSAFFLVAFVFPVSVASGTTIGAATAWA
jgi:hypothetical protein